MQNVQLFVHVPTEDSDSWLAFKKLCKLSSVLFILAIFNNIFLTSSTSPLVCSQRIDSGSNLEFSKKNYFHKHLIALKYWTILFCYYATHQNILFA